MNVVRPSIQGASARYEPLFKLASGGMATVYVGRLVGALGFQRFVAIKRPHRHVLEDPKSMQMLLDEALLASRLQHPNVVSVQDVVKVDGAVYLIMDLVEGVSLFELIRLGNQQAMQVPPAVAVRILLDTCAGLHAAHELCDDDGQPLGLVHRDVSPQNVLVGADGVSRVSDFGIAKCANVRGRSTTGGTLKGKYAYMAPEHIEGVRLDRRADVFSMAVVAWELLAGKRLFLGSSPANTIMRVVHEPAPPLSSATNVFGTAMDDVFAQSLTKTRDERFMSVEAFAAALETCARESTGVASAGDVRRLVRDLVGETLDRRKKQIRDQLDARSLVASDPDRPTEPMPGQVEDHMEQLDTMESLRPQPMPANNTVTYSRPALLPDVERTSGALLASAAPTEATTSASRPRRAWGLVVLAAIAVGVATFGIGWWIDSVGATTSVVEASHSSEEPRASAPPVSTATRDAVTEAAPPDTSSSAASPQPARVAPGNKSAGARGTEPPPKGSVPPPNPYEDWK